MSQMIDPTDKATVKFVKETDESVDKETEGFVEEFLDERVVFDRWERSHSRFGRMVYAAEGGGKTPLCLIAEEAFLLMKRTVLCWPESREFFQQRLPQFQEFLVTF
jgi:hypothetical protein